MAGIVFRSRWLLGPDGGWIEGGGVLSVDGRIRRLLATRAELRRASARCDISRDLGDALMVPGLVNAHAHLELTGLKGRLPRSGPFRAWIRRLIELRSERTSKQLSADARRGARLCLTGGATSVGDVDSSGGSVAGLRRPILRLRLFREVLDAGDRNRSDAALRRVTRPLSAHPLRSEGLSPHAPFTVSEDLMRRAARLARARGMPCCVHWSETPEEIDWLRRGRGPLSSILGVSPRASGLDLIERAGLLREGLSLVHGNHPERGEARRIAEAGAVVVHCPGSHLFFRRRQAPLSAYLRAGVTLALGTDSLASNEDLDLLREMRLVRRSHPELSPRSIWDMATTGGARAIGMSGSVGELRPGAWADIVALACAENAPARFLDAVTSGECSVRGVWIAGRAPRGSKQAPPGSAG
jgi:cytosine/adenosine deaminase-related metal-dependent hydrolase